MKESQLKARETRLYNRLQNNELLTTYDRQATKEKLAAYIDKRKRIE